MADQLADRATLFAWYVKGFPSPWTMMDNVLSGTPVRTLDGSEFQVQLSLTVSIPAATPVDEVQVLIDGLSRSAKENLVRWLVHRSGSQDWGSRTASEIQSQLLDALRKLQEESDCHVVEAVIVSDGRPAVLRVDDRHSPFDPAAVFSAATRGDLTTVGQGLARGLDPNATDDDGCPLLQMPIMGRKFCADEERGESADHLNVLRLLIKSGAKVNATDRRHWTAVHTACFCGDQEVLTLLIGAGADPAARDAKGWNGLHYGAAGGHSRIIETLLAKGVDVNAQSDSSNTPLLIAVESNESDAVDMLLRNGANPDMPNSDGIAPLHSVVLRDDLATTRLLIRGGANPSLRITCSPRPTALHIAASRGAKEIVKVLLEAGADELIRDDDGKTAQSVAREFEQREIAALLGGRTAQRKNERVDTSKRTEQPPATTSKPGRPTPATSAAKEQGQSWLRRIFGRSQ